ncbi:uncharacterized protein LOC141898914 [Tubulanus polymorphus]|uniref:uncharacterized protein LOC141898914 n=1 Tax=Tubulanus polymorphus TaxID=672921 RepID=UPI003DA4D330
MEKNSNKIISAKLVQSKEVTSSSAMEKEGLIRSLHELSSFGIVVKELVTDRHVSIRKMMRTDYSNIKHSFDVWHLEKVLEKNYWLLVKKEGVSSFMIGRPQYPNI